MKTKLTLILLSIGFMTFSQNISKYNNLKKDENLFITVDANDFYYVKSLKSISSKVPIEMEHQINIHEKEVSIYVKWINPLKYNFLIQDSVVNDKRIEILEDFFAQSPISPLPKPSLPIHTKTSVKGNVCGLNGYDKLSITYPSIFSFYVKQTSYYNKKNVTVDSVYFINNAKCEYINQMNEVLNLKIIDKLEERKKLANMLFNCNSIEESKKIIKQVSVELSNWENESNLIQGELFTLNKKTKSITKNSLNLLSSKMTDLYKKNLKAYTTLNTVVGKLKSFTIKIKSSLKGESSDMKGYFHLKTLVLKPFKSIEAKLSITENKISENLEISKLKIIQESKLDIQKYEFISLNIGTGIFYSSADITSHGVSTNDQNQLIISQSILTKNKASTALFINMKFDISSNIIQPMVQIGIDPTKEVPYLLLGGGFILPSSKFSFTAGPIWTWRETLSNYEVGSVIESTNLLEENIEYNFYSKPIGFYIGLDYSFGKK